MLTPILTIMAAWFLVSIVVSLAFGAWLRHLDHPSGAAVADGRSWQGRRHSMVA